MDAVLSLMGRAEGKPVPDILSEADLTRLLAAFVDGKTEILEDDALTLVRWAQQMRMGALVLQMVLDGEIRPLVEDGTVKVALREPGGLVCRGD